MEVRALDLIKPCRLQHRGRPFIPLLEIGLWAPRRIPVVIDRCVVPLRLVANLKGVKVVGSDGVETCFGKLDGVGLVVARKRELQHVCGVGKSAKALQPALTELPFGVQSMSLGRILVSESSTLAGVVAGVIPIRDQTRLERCGWFTFRRETYNDVPPTRMLTGAPVLFANPEMMFCVH